MSIPESNIRNMLRAISKGNHVFNEQVKVYKNTKTICTDCIYDPIRQESTDYNCQTCDGLGQVITEVYSEIPASVETSQDFRYEFTKAGKITTGEIFLTIDIVELEDILNVSAIYDLSDYTDLKAFVQQYDYIVWKGARYTIKNFEGGWLQGNLYEIALTLSLME